MLAVVAASDLQSRFHLFSPSAAEIQRWYNNMFKDVPEKGKISYDYRPKKYSSYNPDIFQQNSIELEHSGFYYKQLSGAEAKEKLKGAEPGRFIIRDSSSSLFYYTMTYIDHGHNVKNIRIQYSFGDFYFETSSKPASRKAKTVIGLLELYSDHSTTKTDKFILKGPIRKTVPSLKQLCRISLNKSKDQCKQSNKDIDQFLQIYPYKL